MDRVPAFSSSTAANFVVGQVGTFTVTTTGYPVPVISATGTLPAGVTLVDHGDGTATLSGAASTSGSFSIVLAASNSAGGTTQAFTLTVAAAGSGLTIVPTALDFGTHRIGSETSKTLQLHNTGTSAIALGKVAISGTKGLEDSFEIERRCGAVLNPGASCTMLLSFEPRRAQAYAATLVIPGASATRALQIPLTGIGTARKDGDDDDHGGRDDGPGDR